MGGVGWFQTASGLMGGGETIYPSNQANEASACPTGRQATSRRCRQCDSCDLVVYSWPEALIVLNPFLVFPFLRFAFDDFSMWES